MSVGAFERSLKELLSLPRGKQPEFLTEVLATLPSPKGKEEWNTRFGPGSLFEAWTASSIATAIYSANSRVIVNQLSTRSDWRILEIGGGDGRLWSQIFDEESVGELHVIDPAPEVHQQMAKVLPGGIRLHSQQCLAQEADWPDVDLVVCSLTLHHVPGADEDECKGSEVKGSGKLAILKQIAKSLSARAGLGILNEADVYCDLGLSQSDPILVDRLLDSYVRRCALALLHDIERRQASDDMKMRWRAVARHWCLEQVQMAHAPIAERDVYELDVTRWLQLLKRADLCVLSHQFTDDYGLFHQYLLRAGGEL
jgi:hypothetical protein